MKTLFFLLLLIPTLTSLKVFGAGVEQFELWVPENQNLTLPEIQPFDNTKNISGIDQHKNWSKKPTQVINGHTQKFSGNVQEYWVKLKFPTSKVDQFVVIGSANIEFAEMHHFRNDQRIDFSFGGLRAASYSINLLARHPVFFIKGSDLPGVDEVYFHVLSLDAMNVSLDQQPINTILEDMEISRFLLYFFMGAVGMLAVYLLVLYEGIRETSILYYLGFTCSFAATMLLASGLLDSFVDPDSKYKFAYLVPFTSSSIIFFAIFFTKEFLELKGRLLTLFNISLLIPIVSLLLSLFFVIDPVQNAGWTRPILTIIQTFAVVIILSGVIFATYKKYPYSKYVVASWLPLGAFTVLDVNRQLPFEKAYGGQLTIIPLVIEMLIMSVAMSEKAIHLSRKAGETKQHKMQNEMLMQILRALSHDLANHFATILTNAEIIGRQFTDPEITKRISKITGAIRRGSQITASVRTWMLANDGRLNLDLRAVNAKSLVTEAISIFEDKMTEKGINISINWPVELATMEIIADETALLNQVLNNCISNAIKFTPRNGDISFEATTVNDELVINIRDTGQGMPMEMVEKINRGETVDSTAGTENEKGTGFGLALMSSYMKAFGGKMTVRSTTIGVYHGTIVSLAFRQKEQVQKLAM